MISVMLLQETEPNADLGWLLYIVLFFYLLKVIVGWLVSRRNTNQPEVMHEAHAAPAVEPPDDLKKIEGIGPKVEKILNNAGVMTFGALASADPAELEKKLDQAGLQMMDPEGWIEQAKLAARGEWADLEKLQNELKGGRRK